MMEKLIAEMDPQQLGQLVAQMTDPDQFVRRGLNEAREVGRRGNVRVPVSQMPEGLYRSPRPQQR